MVLKERHFPKWNTGKGFTEGLGSWQDYYQQGEIRGSRVFQT